MMQNNQETLFKQGEEDKLKQLKGPILKTNIRKSNDGKWLIHETVILDIKPVTYFEKVFSQ